MVEIKQKHQHSDTAVVIIGHGSRLSRSNQHFENFVEFFTRQNPQYAVSFGYIELTEPFMGVAAREAARNYSKVIIAPLLLFRAGHAKKDLPLLVKNLQSEFPEVQFQISAVLGVHPDLVRLCAERLQVAQESLSSAEVDPASTALVVIGRGSRDPDATGDFYEQVRLFAKGRGFARVIPAFVSIKEPDLAEALMMAAQDRPKTIIVVPYFLFAGVLFERIQQTSAEFACEHAWLQCRVAGPLGPHALLSSTLAYRIEQAVSNGS